MSHQENLQPKLRQEAREILGRLSPPEREALLVKNWMSHDARWFMAVASEYDMPVVNRLNRTAAHETGKVEAQRIARALNLPPVKTMDDYLLAHEVFIGLVGPDLADYDIVKVNDSAYEWRVQRCFAYDNAVRAGVTEHLECGVLARTTGWLEAMGLDYEMTPPVGKCLMVEGRECVHTFSFKAESPRPAAPIEDHQ